MLIKFFIVFRDWIGLYACKDQNASFEALLFGGFTFNFRAIKFVVHIIIAFYC